MNSISIPIVHPGFQNLKRSARLLHLFAAIIILSNAVHEYKSHEAGEIYLWTLIFIASDILALTFIGRTLLTDSPWLNKTFRLIETILFIGFSWIYFMEAHYFFSVILFIISAGYTYVFYCENRLEQHERISFHHIGIEMPNLPGNKLIHWTQINTIYTDEHVISITTNESKKIEFNLQKDLDGEELNQIHEFCRHYLKN